LVRCVDHQMRLVHPMSMISKAPYQALTQHGKDYKKWAVGIANIGYGGNTTYSQQLIEVIEHYQLYKLDERSEKL